MRIGQIIRFPIIWETPTPNWESCLPEAPPPNGFAGQFLIKFVCARTYRLLKKFLKSLLQ